MTPVGQHRLARLVDPVRVLDDVEHRFGAGSDAALISAVSPAAAHPDRSWAAQRRDRKSLPEHRAIVL
jgi:hypothetical protein